MSWRDCWGWMEKGEMQNSGMAEWRNGGRISDEDFGNRRHQVFRHTYGK